VNDVAAPALTDRAIGIIATGTILAILYFARGVLVPITLAVILSLLLSPLVRRLRRLGLGATSSVLLAVLALSLSFAAVAAVLGVQAARMANSLPQYEQTIRHKFVRLNELTVDRLAAFNSQTERILGEHSEPKPVIAPVPSESVPRASPERLSAPGVPAQASPAQGAPIPVELHQAPLSPLQVTRRVLGSMWMPLETAGIVLVVLVFVLLERESVRDRFIRIAGAHDLRATTLVLNDAGERLSRFFVSQFAVNIGVGAALWIGLAIIGLPHATLWAALAAVLRFVPYIGVWIAALFPTALAAAVDPGWSLVIVTVCLFVTVELVAGQLVEPQLYGHTTGLSPLSVVIAAIFWSWLWGPIGLVVSTPLTLCLVVAGRHVKALSLLDILLGDSQALTMPERFYQRALSADSDELIATARSFLKHNSLAAYGDFILMPALRLASFDRDRRTITPEQQLKVRQTVVTVIEALDAARRVFTRPRHAVSVLDQVNAGQMLRQQRESLIGRWQGPLVVPPGSIMICVSMGAILDDLGTELLVRALREKKLDARHLSLDDLRGEPPAGASPGGVFMVYLVSAAPGEERKGAEAAAEQIRRRFPGACLVTVFLPGLPSLQSESAIDTIPGANKAAISLVEAVQICLDWLQERTGT
jgi:predicted PurR-regulated permease PerM